MDGGLSIVGGIANKTSTGRVIPLAASCAYINHLRVCA